MLHRTAVCIAAQNLMPQSQDCQFFHPPRATLHNLPLATGNQAASLRPLCTLRSLENCHCHTIKTDTNHLIDIQVDVTHLCGCLGA